MSVVLVIAQDKETRDQLSKYCISALKRSGWFRKYKQTQILRAKDAAAGIKVCNGKLPSYVFHARDFSEKEKQLIKDFVAEGRGNSIIFICAA